jgi:hypothetical protein
MSAGEQRNNRSANDHWSGRGPTTESTQRITPSRMANVGLDELKTSGDLLCWYGASGSTCCIAAMADERNHVQQLPCGFEKVEY